MMITMIKQYKVTMWFGSSLDVEQLISMSSSLENEHSVSKLSSLLLGDRSPGGLQSLNISEFSSRCSQTGM